MSMCLSNARAHAQAAVIGQCTYERTHALNEELTYYRGHLAFTDARTRAQTKSGESA